MLDPAGWLAQAQTLALGQSRRFDHDCGAGRTLKCDHKDDGWSAWCWRCNDKGWHPKPQPSLAERLARLKEKRDTDTKAQADPRPPMPASWDPSEWPLYARVWLYRAALCNDTIRGHGIYYCPRLDRVVLPVVAGGKLVYWQARGFDADRPKYINPEIDKAALAACYGSTGPIVLVEDILSAIRIGEVAEGWSILGTTLSDPLATRLRATGRTVALWFDGDAAGRKARARIKRTLSLVGVEPRIIRTDQDPKLYSTEEISRYIL
jgi:hypothetical protein